MFRLLKISTYYPLPTFFRQYSMESKIVRLTSSPSQLQSKMLASMIEAKMNKLPLEQIMQPLIDYKKSNRSILDTNVHSFLIDLCSTNEEIDAVILDMKTETFFRPFRFKTVYSAWDVKKLIRICDSIKRINQCDSLLSVLQIIVGINISHDIDFIFSYIQNKTTITTLIHHFISKNTQHHLHRLLGVVLKLENYDELANQLKYKILHDEDLYEYVRGDSCWETLRVFILKQYIGEYRNSEGQHYLHRINHLFDQVKSQLEMNLGNNTFVNDYLFTKNDIRPLALDLSQTCLERDNFGLAAKAFDIFNCKRYVYLSMKDKDRYFTNLLHLQSIARVRAHSKNKIEQPKNLLEKKFIDHTLTTDIDRIGLLPSPLLFSGYLHSRMVDMSAPIDKNLAQKLYLLIDIRKKDDILMYLTEWTRYYKPDDIIPNNIYCNMLYLLISVAARMEAMLTPQHVDDVLRRLTPYMRKAEEKKSLSKAVDYFDTQLNVLYRNNNTEVPIEIHNSVLLAFAKAKHFTHMRQKFDKMANEQILGNEKTFDLLISTATIRCLEDECEFIQTKVWNHVKQFFTDQPIPIHLIEGLINCSLKTQNYQKSISFVEYAHKAEGKLRTKLVDEMFNIFCKAGKRNEMNDLKKILNSSSNLDYEDIIEKYSI